MEKPKVLLIKTGGTISQRRNNEGIYEPCADEYLNKIEGLNNLAELTILDMGVIDSTNMETSSTSIHAKNRAEIARVIYKSAFTYDGFVVVHGTDTMCETAVAFTYMLPDFRRPIVLTGAQRSIWEPNSDGRNNVYTAVQAATKDFGEVVIAFGNYILRGTRALKVDEEGYDAFDTPDHAPLGKITSLEEGIRLAEHRVRRGDFEPRIFTDFKTNVFNYAHISGATVDHALMKLAEDETLDGFLMAGFGAGNIPERLLPFIKKARELEKPVYVYTQCDVGAADMGIYSVGAASLKAGAQPAGDMTLEALGQKLMYVLGRAASECLKDEERMQFIDTIIRKSYNNDIIVTQRRR